MDIDDWQITSEFFALLEQYWGPHTIDCFTNFYNTTIIRFFLRFWNPGTAGVDAFFQSWQNENCLLVPPITLVCETLKHMDRGSAVGTLVIPDWPSSAFWPLLWGHYKNAIVTFSRHKGKNVIFHGRNSILYLVPQTGRGTFMPSDLIFANCSLWCLPGAGLNAFSHWARLEQAIVIVSCVKPLGSPRAGFIVILKGKYLLSGFI